MTPVTVITQEIVPNDKQQQRPRRRERKREREREREKQKKWYTHLIMQKAMRPAHVQIRFDLREIDKFDDILDGIE